MSASGATLGDDLHRVRSQTPGNAFVLPSCDASTGHAGKLREVEWLFPLQPALGKHLQHRRDQFRSIQAAESHKDSAGETVQIVGKQASTAVRTEVANEALAGFSDIVERLRLAAEEREIIFWHTKESRRRAPGGPFAVVAMAGRDKSRICIELELHCTTGALCRVFLAHVIWSIRNQLMSLICNSTPVGPDNTAPFGVRLTARVIVTIGR